MEASSKHSNAKKTADNTPLADSQQALIKQKAGSALEYFNAGVSSHGFRQAG
jgi:hypothetical protein